MDVNKIRECAYTILDNAQAIMMECNRENPYGGYLLEKIKPIENDLEVIKNLCINNTYEKDENKCSICGKEIKGVGNNAQPINNGRCCNQCNDSVVIPRRMNTLLEDERRIKNGRK